MDSEKSGKSAFFQDLWELSSENLAPNEKINRAIDIGRQRLGVDYGVLSYTGEGDYEIVDTNIATGKYTPGSVTALEETWCRHVVDTGEAIGFADASETEYRDDIARETTGLQCYVGVPITIDGETYGTLCYSNEAPREEAITDDERHFVSLLAEWISHELEREKHHRELREQNERLDEFAGIVAHDLRNPLAGAVGFTEMALDVTEGEATDYLQRVDRSLDRMDALIGECLVLAKEGTDIGQRTEVDLARVVREAWETITSRDASLSVDAEGTIKADEARLQRVFENLFRNAVEHCQPGVSITVAGGPNGITISDDGPGLPPGVVDALTDADVENIKEIGLGLLIVERVVSGHGWDLAVETSAQGTTFEITGINRAAPTHREVAEA